MIFGKRSLQAECEAMQSGADAKNPLRDQVRFKYKSFVPLMPPPRAMLKGCIGWNGSCRSSFQRGGCRTRLFILLLRTHTTSPRPQRKACGAVLFREAPDGESDAPRSGFWPSS